MGLAGNSPVCPELQKINGGAVELIPSARTIKHAWSLPSAGPSTRFYPSRPERHKSYGVFTQRHAASAPVVFIVDKTAASVPLRRKDAGIAGRQVPSHQSEGRAVSDWLRRFRRPQQSQQ